VQKRSSYRKIAMMQYIYLNSLYYKYYFPPRYCIVCFVLRGCDILLCNNAHPIGKSLWCDTFTWIHRYYKYYFHPRYCIVCFVL